MSSIRRILVLVPIVSLALLPAASAQTSRESVATGGTEADRASLEPSISNDGRWIAFESLATQLASGDANGSADVFVRDVASGTTQLVSQTPGGAAGNRSSAFPAISGDGRCVVFWSESSDLVPNDLNGVPDIFVRDLASGATERVNLSAAGAEDPYGSMWPAISGDGRFVTFLADAQLAPGDGNAQRDVYVRDRALATTQIVSVKPNGLAGLFGHSTTAAISADGRYVAFDSTEAGLVTGDTNGVQDVFVRDLVLGVTQRVSLASSGAEGDAPSQAPSISADGRFVVFESFATNLEQDLNGHALDIFLHDRILHTTTLVSRTSSASGSDSACISADGRWIAFESGGSDLVANDTNIWRDVFLFETATWNVELASVSSSFLQGDLFSRTPTISGDGQRIAFMSGSTNLVLGDTNGELDVFLRDRSAALPQIYCTAKMNSAGCAPVTFAGGTASASTGVTFQIGANLVLNHKHGRLFYGYGASSLPFDGGVMCVQAPLRFTALQDSGGSTSGVDCTGSYVYDFNSRIRSGVDPALTPGQTVFAQHYSRDPASPSTTGLTDAVRFTIQP